MFIPPQFLRPAKLDQVNGPAVVLEVGSYGAPFLVFGDGDRALACFVGPSDSFETMPLKGAGGHTGLAIEGIEFELDIDSRYMASGVSPRIGSLVRSGRDLQIVTVGPGAFRRPSATTMLTGFNEAPEDEKVGFSRWRAFVRDQFNPIVTYEVLRIDADTLATRQS